MTVDPSSPILCTLEHPTHPDVDIYVRYIPRIGEIVRVTSDKTIADFRVDAVIHEVDRRCTRNAAAHAVILRVISL